MSSLGRFLKLGEEKPPGPFPSYTRPHVVRALLIIGDAGSKGRQALAREIGVGEGAARTIIKKLKDGGYIGVETNGCRLTTKGRATYREVRGVLPKLIGVPTTKLTVGSVQAAALVKRAASSAGNGIPQRDAAIMVGASGATTLVLEGSKFHFPKDPVDCESEYPGETWSDLRKNLEPSDGDAIIICGSEDRNLSFVGAIAAALTLIG